MSTLRSLAETLWIRSGSRLVSHQLLHRFIVKCDDGNEIRWRSYAANERSEVGYCRFRAVKKSQVTVSVSKINAKPPKLFFSSRRRHTRFDCDWSSDVCSSD